MGKIAALCLALGLAAPACSSSRVRSGPIGGKRRSRALFGAPLALDRPLSRRARAGRGRRARRDGALLLRRRQRRRVGDERCRPDLAADLRRPADRLHRRARPGAFESEGDLRGHRRGRHALRHRPGRRDVQVRRRREELCSHRARRLAADREDPGRPARRGSGPGRGSRPPLRSQHRARRLSLRATGAGSGNGCSTATRTPAPSISRSSRAIPASCTRLSGRRAGRPGTSTRRPTGRAAACTNRRTAAAPGRRSAGAAFRPTRAASASPWRPAGPNASTPSWTPSAAGSTARTTTARAGRSRATIARIWGRGWYFGGIAVEPRDADVVYAGNTSLYRSQDGGRTFAPIKGAPGGDDYHELWIDPVNPERRMLGVDQGALVSLNGGETWSSWYNQPTGQFYRVATDNRFPYSGVRLAAGLGRGRRSEPHDPARRDQPDAAPA